MTRERTPVDATKGVTGEQEVRVRLGKGGSATHREDLHRGVLADAEQPARGST